MQSFHLKMIIFSCLACVLVYHVIAWSTSVNLQKITLKEHLSRSKKYGSRDAKLFFEVDTESYEPVSQYFDEFNFCLERKTNSIIKNILILNAPEDKVPAIRELNSIIDQFKSEYESESGYNEAFLYLNSVCLLGMEESNSSGETISSLAENYKIAYNRFLSVLRDFGCSPLDSNSTGRCIPTDMNICLSIMDSITERPTRTKALNSLSNRVLRTMCVGNDEDLACLVQEMISKKVVFFSRWNNDSYQWKESQEELFYHALLEEIVSTEWPVHNFNFRSATTHSSQTFNKEWRKFTICSTRHSLIFLQFKLYFDELLELLSNGLTANPQKLNNAWSNAFTRLMTVLVRELGARRTPASSRVLSSFISWESDLRRNLTSVAWDPNPADLVGSWVVGDDMDLLPDVGSYVGEKPELRVVLNRDGSVEIPTEAGEGLHWRLEPGPTHLDTLKLEIRTKGEAEGTLLDYTGYIDRGARIEARFSRRPIKVMFRMTGRLTKTVRGEPIPSTRFSMRLVERRE